MSSGSVKVLGLIYSPFVNRVQIALYLKSVEFELIHEDLDPKSELLLKSNPVHKKIPVLFHDDKIICESGIIVQYIDETWTGNGFSILPSDPYDRAIARFWAAYFDDKVVSVMLDLILAPESEMVAVTEQLAEQVVPLEEAFVTCSKGKSFFGGDNIGYTDIVLGSFISWIKAIEIMSGIKVLAEEKTPRLVGWVSKFLSTDAAKEFASEPEVYVELLEKMRVAYMK